MKKYLSTILGVVLLLAGFAHGQATLSSTTLSAAIDQDDTSLTVASATGITAGTTMLYIDREAINVLAVSGTRLTVSRGVRGTRGTGHTSGAVVYLGPPKHFSANDYYGSCTSTDEVVLPRINVINGRRFDCINGEWDDLKEEVIAEYIESVNASMEDAVFFVANRTYQVTACREIHAVASSGATNVQVVKDTGTDAPGAGTNLLTNDTSAGFQTDGTANTVEVGALTATLASKRLAVGDRLAVDFSGTLTALEGLAITCNLKPF